MFATISLIFPGQGSQAVGMGMELAAQFPVAKAVFEEVDDALGEKLSTLIADGPAEDLTLTKNTQPALMAVSIAAFRVLQEEGLTDAHITSMAGHSLGEYSAHCAAGALSLSDTARLLRLRGEAMQAAVPVGEGAMAAILGLDLEQVETLLDGGNAQVANDNSPGQVVISGSKAAIDAACVAAKEAGAKRALPLPVSAPFHCALMGPAQEKMAAALAEAVIEAPKVPIFANVLAAPITSPDDIRRTLTEQVTGRVRWTETITAMSAAGTETFIEVGAGKVLTGLVKRIVKGTKAFNVGAPGDLEAYREAVA
ncbi:MAG: ACP S-malonyltransferase, partial [Pseudomonadota bacterium]